VGAIHLAHSGRIEYTTLGSDRNLPALKRAPQIRNQRLYRCEPAPIWVRVSRCLRFKDPKNQRGPRPRRRGGKGSGGRERVGKLHIRARGIRARSRKRRQRRSQWWRWRREANAQV